MKILLKVSLLLFRKAFHTCTYHSRTLEEILKYNYFVFFIKIFPLTTFAISQRCLFKSMQYYELTRKRSYILYFHHWLCSVPFLPSEWTLKHTFRLVCPPFLPFIKLVMLQRPLKLKWNVHINIKILSYLHTVFTWDKD